MTDTETAFTLEWREELRPVLERATEHAQQAGFHSNRFYVTYALLIMSAQGEEELTPRMVVEFVHSNFAPLYRSRREELVPHQRRWIGFNWEKWDDYVPSLVEILKSDNPMEVFDS